MKHHTQGLYCGVFLGAFYYFLELVWNWSFDKLIVQLKSLLVAFSLYIVAFSILGLVVSLARGLVFDRKNRSQDLRLIQVAWVSTAAAGSFFGSIFFIARVFFMRSGLTKGIVVMLVSTLAFAICYLLYYLINRTFKETQDHHKLYHLAGLITINLFLIMVIKINMELRTAAWSPTNLFWDLMALLGSIIVGGFCLFLFHTFRRKSEKSVLGLKKIFIICVGIGIAWGLYSVVGTGKDVRQNTGEIAKKEHSLPPVILITLDTVRADHLTSYGYERETSPNIDRFVEDGVRFKKAICQIPLTRPSLFSILTGRYPLSHGLLDNWIATPKDTLLLSDTLEKDGYNTAAFVSAPILSSSFNTKFGFQEYYDQIMNVFLDDSFLLILDSRYLGIIDIKNENSAAETNQKVFDWLERNSHTSFFLWIHYFDPHTPYTPDVEYKTLFSKKEYDIHKFCDYHWEKTHYDNAHKEVNLEKGIIQYGIDLYDAEIRGMDHELGRLFHKFKELNLYERSLIILTADHGESFEHGYYFDHGDRLYDGLIHIPLILKFPKQRWKGETILTQVETIDIAPTLLECLSLNPIQGMEGRSLMALIPGQKNDDSSRRSYAYSQTPYRSSFYYKAKELQSLRTNQWKFILDVRTGQRELYSLTDDPEEHKNCSSMRPVVLEIFESVLLKFNDSFRKHGRKPERIKIDPATEEKIKSLGYIK